jgi:DNA-binding transcriptional regulator GbsR (MarR family)
MVTKHQHYPSSPLGAGVIYTIKFMEAKELVLDAMKKAGVPLNAGKIVELTGLERKEVDKAMKQLKADEAIVSPKNCFWQPK